MATLYWAALVVGVGLAALSLAGDVFGADGLDAADGAVDFDSVDADADGEGLGGLRILTIRNLMYFLMGFGGVGVLLGWLWADGRAAVTFIAASGTGLLSAGISAAAFGYVRRTGSGDMPDDRALVGLVGDVVLPLAAGGTGKILVRRGGRELELLARPLHDEAPDAGGWTSVLVVELRDGIAYVTPYRDAIES